MSTRILVGSTNPVKIAATREAFSKHFDDVLVEGFSAGSDVPSQPINEQTYDGARNRALALKEHDPGASFYVGIEGGIEETNKTWFAFGGVCIIDAHGRESIGKSPHFTLPQRMISRLLAGEELGKVMDKHVGEDNTKHKSGAVGILTKGAMDRKELYAHGVAMALIPFLNEELYFGKTSYARP